MVRLVIALVVTTVLGLLAVAEQLTTIRAGYEIDRLRHDLVSQGEKRRELELVVGRLSTPEALQSRSASLRLDLAIPDRPRVVRVRPAVGDGRAYAEAPGEERHTAERRR